MLPAGQFCDARVDADFCTFTRAQIFEYIKSMYAMYAMYMIDAEETSQEVTLKVSC